MIIRKIPSKVPGVGDTIDKMNILSLKENQCGNQIVMMRYAQPLNKDDIKPYIIFESLNFVCTKIIGYSIHFEIDIS